MDPKVYAEMRKLGLSNRWDLSKARKVVKTFRSDMKEIKESNIIVTAEAITMTGDAVIATASLKLMKKLHQLGSLGATKMMEYLSVRQDCIACGMDPASLPAIPACIMQELQKNSVILIGNQSE
jgi:hypothetical protein